MKKCKIHPVCFSILFCYFFFNQIKLLEAGSIIYYDSDDDFDEEDPDDDLDI